MFGTMPSQYAFRMDEDHVPRQPELRLSPEVSGTTGYEGICGDGPGGWLTLYLTARKNSSQLWDECDLSFDILCAIGHSDALLKRASIFFTV